MLWKVGTVFGDRQAQNCSLSGEGSLRSTLDAGGDLSSLGLSSPSPCFAPEQRCNCRPLSTGRACSAALGHHSVHVHTCAFGPRQRRHNTIRDAWLALLTAAHWHADIEQIVRTGEDAFHRADIAAAAPDGTLWAFDVSIKATPGPEDIVHAHLERSANAKASRYRFGGDRRLPDGHTLVALIHSAA